MASPSKVSWAQLRVGLLAVGGLALIAALVFALTGSKNIFAGQSRIYTFMDNSAALVKGAPVRLNGILAGEVKEVVLSGQNTPGRIVKVVMEVESDFLKQIPVDSLASISAENVLGTKFININKGRSTTLIQAEGEVKALDTAEFEEVVQQGYTLLASLQGILKRVDSIVSLVEVGKGSIGKLLVDEELYNRALAIVADGQKLADAISSPKGTIGRLVYDDALYRDVQASLGRVDSVIADLQAGKGTAGKFLKDDALFNELQADLQEFRKTLNDLNAGKGTAGKLLKDEAFYNQLQASMGKVDLMIDKVNSGQGTIGQLLVNPQMYDSLNGATAEMQQLIKDVRANPKKFLRIRLSIF